MRLLIVLGICGVCVMHDLCNRLSAWVSVSAVCR